MDSVISINNIAKEYKASRTKTVRALGGVSFDVARGEIFSLLGPNGAGKTTLIKLLLGIIHPTAGGGSLLGKPLGDVEAKSRIGYLPENHRYPNYLTGEQVLRHFGQLANMSGSTLETRINDVLKMFNMEEWRTTKMRKYSKGMLQRIGLAQALINSPDVVFLDEPTDGVDPVGRRDIRSVLSHLKDTGVTVFLNSHLLSEVELISDRVAILNKGELLKIGTVDELTRTTNETVFDVAGDIDVAAAAVRTVIPNASIDGHRVVIETNDTAEVNKVMDALRGAGIDIREIVKRHASLEDAFMELIEKVD